MSDDRSDRAKKIILELIRQSPGDRLRGKVRLYKAFYYAHLYYASNHSRYLSDWPIVRMPNGPGIGGFDALAEEMKADGAIKISTKKNGPHHETVFRAVSTESTGLSEHEVRAIRSAIEFIGRKSGAKLSDLTHVFSRSWANAKDGEELNIYQDISADKTFEADQAIASEAAEMIAKAWED